MLKKLARAIASIPKIFSLYSNPLVYYYAKLGFLSRRKTIICNLKNRSKFKIHIGNSDINSINEIFLSKGYPLALGDLRPDDVAVDVGANIGIVSVAIAAKLKSGKVYALEPNPEILGLLKENIALNNLENKVVPIPLCVAGKAGRRELYFEPTMWGGASIINSRPEAKARYLVDCISLNELFEAVDKDRINFLKLDVEGTEHEILCNTKGHTFDKIDRILVEYHEPRVSPGAIREILENNNFIVKKLSDINAFYARKR